MKAIYILLFISLTSFVSPETQVYICGSTGAKKYHYKENCRGLSACKQETCKVPISQAKKYGLTLCGWED